MIQPLCAIIPINQKPIILLPLFTIIPFSQVDALTAHLLRTITPFSQKLIILLPLYTIVPFSQADTITTQSRAHYPI